MWQLRSVSNILKVEEIHASDLPIQIKDDLSHSLDSASRSRDDVLDSYSAIISQLPRKVIHELLGGSDCMGYGHEPSMMPKLSCMTLATGPSRC